MNTNLETLRLLPKYVHAICSDATLFFSDEPTIATQERKVILLHDISLIKEQLLILEKYLNM
jgi:hypothetical protein